MQPQQPQFPQQQPPGPAPMPPDVPQPLPAQAFVPSYGDPSSAPSLTGQVPPLPDHMPGATPPIQPAAYDFITSPQQGRRGPVLAVAGFKQKLLFGIGVVVLLLIVITIGSKLFSSSGGGDLTSLTAVAVDQQEFIHLTAPGNTNNQQNLSSTTTNLVSTIQVAMVSSQAQLLKYMTVNHYKLKAAQLQTAISTSVDQQLTAAAGAGTYDTTLQGILKDRLTSYEQGLKQAYNLNPGPKGRALLTSDFNQAQLLAGQLTGSGS